MCPLAVDEPQSTAALPISDELSHSLREDVSELRRLIVLQALRQRSGARDPMPWSNDTSIW
jgi:hypothetical protein